MERLNYTLEEYAGHKVYHCPVLDSTNLLAKALARAGEEHGTVAVADEQTCGRGRFDRKWLSRPGYGAWFTLIVRPEKGRVKAESAGGLVFVAALAMAQVLNAQAPGTVLIKWPNDLVARGRKICGIMCEMNADAEGLNWAVLGIGVNLRGHDFPADLSWAGSLESETGVILSPEEAITAFLCRFDELYEKWLARGLSPILRGVSAWSATIGKRVRVTDAEGGVVEGTAVRMMEDGALAVETAEGLNVVRAGDVSVRGTMGYV